jgi:alpha-ketoglutarate-dependent taurine dioxygenase
MNPIGNSRKPSLAGLATLTPRTLGAAAPDLVRQRPLNDHDRLPLLVEPARPGVDLIAWVRATRQALDALLGQHGGILFRGFDIPSTERFEELVAAAGGEALEYRERSSPRSAVAGRIYTSTDYPPDQPIFLHNENSYAHTWPRKILFFCQTEPTRGGETPIADVRRVHDLIPDEVRMRFRARGVLYVRNFSDAVGLSWPTVFQTSDRAAVEAQCRHSGYEIEWLPDNRLRTRRFGPAILEHPRTGEPVWFNHATFFHVSTLPEPVRRGLLDLFPEEDLPNNTYYGDGKPIEPEVLDLLREAYRTATVSFSWRAGDVLLLDNMLVAHGRAPYAGPRKVLVGMAEPVTVEDLR